MTLWSFDIVIKFELFFNLFKRWEFCVRFLEIVFNQQVFEILSTIFKTGALLLLRYFFWPSKEAEFPSVFWQLEEEVLCLYLIRCKYVFT